MDKRTRRQSIKKLRSEADKLWKIVVLRNYEGKCYVCGSKFMVDSHHFIPRRISLNLRYNPENGICLCRKCHSAVHWKSDPIVNLMIVLKKGSDWIKYIQNERNKKIKPSIQWYEEQIRKLKEKL